MIPRCNVLGVGVSAVNLPAALGEIGRWVARRERQYVCVTGVHGVMESQRDPDLKRIHNAAGLVTPDGMPLVWVSRACGFRRVDQVCGRDLMLALCGLSVENGWRHFFYGGREGVAQTLAGRLRERCPGLRVAGVGCPPFRPLTEEEDSREVEAINESGADVVWVGLGAPKQERWMAAHRGRLQAPVLVGVGAAFDFHAGLLPVPPRWVQRSGLEWLFRLAAEPRRLWSRYAVNNPLFLALLLGQWLGLREDRLEAGRVR